MQRYFRAAIHIDAMNPAWNVPLLVAGALDALAALLHLACIVFGAPWYRFFGAGERTARLAEAGSHEPALVTSGIALVLAIWAMYALSGAGAIARLPMLRPALCAIAAIYLLRGVAGFALIAHPLGRTPAFWIWSSAICLLIGFTHLLGVRQAWASL
jgi:hypothetical protein